jgi:uridine nucleosidase
MTGMSLCECILAQVHGNASQHDTWKNALRLLHAFGAPMQGPHAYAGATKPLIREAKQDPEIHGADGLGGVEGLPEFTDPLVQARLQQSGNTRAIEAMAKAIQETWDGGRGQRTTLVTTGPQTNLALFLSVYSDLEPAIEEIVFMGGGLGLGNRSAVAGRAPFLKRIRSIDCIFRV